MVLRIEDSVIGLLSKYYIKNEHFMKRQTRSVHSLNKLLSACCVVGAVLGIGYTRVNKIVSALKELKCVNWRVLLQYDNFMIVESLYKGHSIEA